MNPEELWVRRAVVVLSAVIYWGGVWVQARRVRKRIGRSPNVKPRGAKEKLLWAGWIFVVVVWMFQPLVAGIAAAWPVRMLPFGLNLLSLVFGLSLIVAGYAGTLWCYAAMGSTWRMGINRKEKNDLVTQGPYRSVRHPIYLFQVIMLLGAALLLPTPLSLLIVLIHLACVLIKAADEESYLQSVHGQTYRDYLARTGRLLPKLTK